MLVLLRPFSPLLKFEPTLESLCVEGEQQQLRLCAVLPSWGASGQHESAGRVHPACHGHANKHRPKTLGRRFGQQTSALRNAAYPGKRCWRSETVMKDAN